MTDREVLELYIPVTAGSSGNVMIEPGIDEGTAWLNVHVVQHSNVTINGQNYYNDDDDPLELDLELPIDNGQVNIQYAYSDDAIEQIYITARFLLDKVIFSEQFNHIHGLNMFEDGTERFFWFTSSHPWSVEVSLDWYPIWGWAIVGGGLYMSCLSGPPSESHSANISVDYIAPDGGLDIELDQYIDLSMFQRSGAGGENNYFWFRFIWGDAAGDQIGTTTFHLFTDSIPDSDNWWNKHYYIENRSGFYQIGEHAVYYPPTGHVPHKLLAIEMRGQVENDAW